MADAKRASIAGTAVATPFGTGTEPNCTAFFEGRNTFRTPGHYDSKGLLAGIDPDLDKKDGSSRAFRLLRKLKDAITFPIPPETPLFLSTTVGAIDLLEQGSSCDTSTALLEEAKRIFGLKQATLVSAACASGQMAVSLALEQIHAGNCPNALVIGCDIASEFVTSGFTALGAVSKTICRPYDKNRDGLVLGEAAGAILLTAYTPGTDAILGAAESCDAAHITAPDLGGTILKQAILSAMDGQGIIGGVIGHGTGTVYNDLAEINALNAVFSGTIPPLYSLKGNLGHTLGATGVLQIIFGLEFSRRGMMPPQANLQEPAVAAVSNQSQQLLSRRLLTLNVGFGGLNSALILEAAQ